MWNFSQLLFPLLNLWWLPPWVRRVTLISEWLIGGLNTSHQSLHFIPVRLSEPRTPLFLCVPISFFFLLFVLKNSDYSDWNDSGVGFSSISQSMCVFGGKEGRYVFKPTFIEADFVPQYDHAFREQLVLKVLSEEGAQFRLQQLPAWHTHAHHL